LADSKGYLLSGATGEADRQMPDGRATRVVPYDLRFSVYVKDGKTALRATPIRE
jgi:hypothetical protein